MFFVFSGIGVVVYVLAIGIVAPAAAHLQPRAPTRRSTGQIVLLIIAVNVALHFVFSVFGGVINGFERYDINNVVGTRVQRAGGGASTCVVLWLGYGLVELVAATTAVPA